MYYHRHRDQLDSHRNHIETESMDQLDSHRNHIETESMVQLDSHRNHIETESMGCHLVLGVECRFEHLNLVLETLHHRFGRWTGCDVWWLQRHRELRAAVGSARRKA